MGEHLTRMDVGLGNFLWQLLRYRVFFSLVPPLKTLSTKKLIQARLDVSRPIYVNVDSPNLDFPYFNFLGGVPVKKNTLQKFPGNASSFSFLLNIITIIFAIIPVILDNVEVSPNDVLPLLTQTLPSAKLVQKVNSPPFGIIQGVFLHWASPKKYGKPRLGESTLTQLVLDTPNQQPGPTFLYFELLRGGPV